MFGAWALEMLYDHHHGRDFVDESFELRHSMFPGFTPRFVGRYIERFSDGFDSIDLSPRSKVRIRATPSVSAIAGGQPLRALALRAGRVTAA
jgi:hypothetical protein